LSINSQTYKDVYFVCFSAKLFSPNLQNKLFLNRCSNAKYCLSKPIDTIFPNPLKSLSKFDFHRKIEQIMEVIAIQKSVLDGMKKELKALLEVNENATKKYTSIFKKEK
jgi:hypothetical protein